MGEHGADAPGPRVADAVAGAATALLSGLTADLASRCRRPFSDSEGRRRWHYVPGEREGVALGDLDRSGRRAVHRLLATVLREHAHAQAAMIMALEDVLDRLEDGRRGRHSGDYWTAVYGEPGDDAWGWRFEGHHVSVNATVVHREVVATPLFLGANPATVAYAGGAVSRPLAAEEELARHLLDTLPPGPLARAVVADEAPPDILTRNEPRVRADIEPRGLARADLSGAAADAFDRLVLGYVERLPAGLAEHELRRLERAGRGALHLAWAGPVQRGGGHYYRLQGPTLLVEYDSTQDDANHVHTVWRDPERDFGADLLAAHRARDHAP